MKKDVQCKLFVSIVFVLAMMASHCGTPGEITEENVVEHLAELINSKPNVTFKIDLEKSTVESDGGNYRVTFKNSAITSDIPSMMKIFYNHPFSSESEEVSFTEAQTLQVEEAKLLYYPGKKALNLESLKGLFIKMDSADKSMSKGIPGFDIKNNGAEIFLASATFEDHPIDCLIKTSEEKELEKNATSLAKEKKKLAESVLNNLKVEVSYLINKMVNLSFVVQLDELKNGETYDRGEAQNVILYVLEPDARKPNLHEVLA
ncbi:MAG: hypothetical protein GY757_43830, partial [bacterium]|nr:hypothetical protein [bacterium]